MPPAPLKVLLFAALACASLAAPAQQAADSPQPGDDTSAEPAAGPDARGEHLPTIVVNASADASEEGLSPAFAGGQVAQGGRAGILGTRDHLETPFSITSYTNELIQDQQARSVGDVLQNDPTVRVARGFGNFQESYFIRGFILGSDDVAFNGLYSLLPRQYIATELFERVEVLRGASAFLTGANPGGGGLGGAINLLPKRAPNEALTRVTAGTGSGGFGSTAVDIGRRFGPEQRLGLRLNAAYRDGDTAVDDESAKLGLVSLGADWRGDRLRLSADLGWQDNQLDQTRTNVSLSGVTAVPDAPDAGGNFAQPWSYSDEEDLLGTFRGEYDLHPAATAWAAYGLRRSEEANSLANLTVTNAQTGDGNTSRFDNAREDRVDTGELGLRGSFRTGAIGHQWVIAAAWFRSENDNAYEWDFFNTLATNLYRPTAYPLPPFGGTGFSGNELSNPRLTARTSLSSLAVGDTLSLLDERLLLTLGARLQRLKIENFAYDTGAAAPKYDDERLSPSLGVVYRLTPRLSLYTNYVEGLTQGETAPQTTPDGQPVANAGEMLEPYVSQQQEIGAKFETQRLGLGVAVFATDRPRQLLVDGRFTDEGEDRHRGVELSAYGMATSRVRVLGGVTLLDAEQRATGDTTTEGEHVIGVPRFQASFGSELMVPAVPGLSLDARVVHTGTRYADAINTLKVDDWTRLDLGGRYLTEIAGKLVSFRARIDNVFDEDYWASVGGFPGNGYLVVGGPLSVATSVSMDF